MAEISSTLSLSLSLRPITIPCFSLQTKLRQFKKRFCNSINYLCTRLIPPVTRNTIYKVSYLLLFFKNYIYILWLRVRYEYLQFPFVRFIRLRLLYAWVIFDSLLTYSKYQHLFSNLQKIIKSIIFILLFCCETSSSK